MFFAELADALAAPTFTHRLALYIGHDGTLVRLLAGLGASPLRWPSLGSEVVLEVRTLCARVAIDLCLLPCYHLRTGLGSSQWHALHTRISRGYNSPWNGVGAIG